MKISQSEMVKIWRSRLGLEGAYPDAAVDRADGINLDAFIADKARQWYLHALDHAPLSCLVTTDKSAELQLLLEPAEASATLGVAKLPQTWRRIAAVQLFGWHLPAVPQQLSRLGAERLASRYAMPGVAEPAAYLTNTHLVVAPLVRRQVLVCEAVVDPGPEFYEFHESLLNTIPDSIDISNL